MKKTQNISPAILITIMVFFFWGFTASGNALLIPVLKLKFNLKQHEAQYVEFSFYAAYFGGSLLFFIFSKRWPDKIKKWGAKNVMILGLLISAVGTVSLALASGKDSYFNVLLALFIIAVGFSLQQIIANFLMLILGNKNNGTQRLILAGAINSLGNTLAPLVLGHFIFKNQTGLTSSLENIKPMLYMIAIMYVTLALFFYKVSVFGQLDVQQKSAEEQKKIWDFPQLWMGMIAIFFYVGCEVSLQSNLPALVASTQIMGLDTADALHYFSLFGGSLLIGRWTGAIYNFNLSKKMRILLIFAIPYFIFSIVLIANYLKGTDLNLILDYAPWLITISLVVYLAGEQPQKTLLYSGYVAVIFIFGSLMTTGKIALYFIICVANVSALMWPCIFGIALKNTGKYGQEGSSLLVMMVIGGAIIPPLQGALADNPLVGIKDSFVLPMVGYLSICIYAAAVGRLDKQQAKLAIN